MLLIVYSVCWLWPHSMYHFTDRCSSVANIVLQIKSLHSGPLSAGLTLSDIKWDKLIHHFLTFCIYIVLLNELKASMIIYCEDVLKICKNRQNSNWVFTHTGFFLWAFLFMSCWKHIVVFARSSALTCTEKETCYFKLFTENITTCSVRLQ